MKKNNKILHSIILNNKINNYILIVHGLFGNGKNWISIANKLSKHYQIHLLDMRNHGSSFYSKNMNYNVMSKDIFNYINYFNIKHPILIGHSIGGKVVMQFAIEYPNIPYKIVIVDISPRKYTYNQNNIINILKKVNFSYIKSRKELDNFLKKYINDIQTRLFFLKCTNYAKNGKLKFTFYLESIDKNYHMLLMNNNFKNKYYNPTLFLIGELSNFFIKKDYNIVKNIFPKSKILTIKNSKHWIHIDNPKEFYERIIEFLRK